MTERLGTTLTLYGNEANEFRKQLDEYVNSPDRADDLAYWPIIKKVPAALAACVIRWSPLFMLQVVLWCPADILSSGCVLVDAPGMPATCQTPRLLHLWCISNAPLNRRRILLPSLGCGAFAIRSVHAGMRDDNAARDAVVKAHLKDADVVIICSNIKRGADP